MRKQATYPNTPVVNTTAKRRCAVYTRKSTDEGLDMEYNSLEAQRDAGLAYIASQRHEGWIAVPDGYDDGGFSGGNIERPSLKRLMADIEAGKIDIVVVYKIDRLTRNLTDFSKLVEIFDQHGVSFVSVTQQFNTETSMGRLMLNVMLSFAQFEREVTGERIRDKIAASKAKGMWMGGVPPLGYDVKDRKLEVNETEAALVRDIFTRYAEHGSAARLVRELQIEGHTTKSWETQTGKFHHGRTFDQQNIFKMLRNRLYIGEIAYKTEVFKGQHQAIITTAQWEAVQDFIAQRKRSMRRDRYNETPALLAGFLYAPDGQRMLPTFTQKKNGKRYHYYVPYLEKRQSAGASRIPGQRGMGPMPAAEIESAVLMQVLRVLQEPEMIMGVWREVLAVKGGEVEVDEPTVVVAMRRIGDIWAQMFPVEQHRIMRLLVERVQLHQDGLDIVWREDGWQRFRRELAQHPFVVEQKEAAACGQLGRDEEVIA